MSNYLIDLIPNGFTGTILFHDTPWFTKGGGSHRDMGHNSNSHAVVECKLDLIEKYGRGIPSSQLGVIEDWYGFKGNALAIDNASRKMMDACDRRGMKFSLCFDAGISQGKINQEMVDAVDYAKYVYFDSPSFAKDETGKPLCIEFSAGYADWKAITAKYAIRVLHWTNDKQNGFSWIRPGANAHTQLIQDNTQVYMPAVCPGFSDRKPDNPKQGIWGEEARNADYENGCLWLDCWKNIPATAKFIQVVTASDFEERTGIFGNLGFPGLPGDVILPTGNAIPMVFFDLLVKP